MGDRVDRDVFPRLEFIEKHRHDEAQRFAPEATGAV